MGKRPRFDSDLRSCLEFDLALETECCPSVKCPDRCCAVAGSAIEYCQYSIHLEGFFRIPSHLRAFEVHQHLPIEYERRHLRASLLAVLAVSHEAARSDCRGNKSTFRMHLGLNNRFRRLKSCA